MVAAVVVAAWWVLCREKPSAEVITQDLAVGSL
jgi:hypothetical protein